MAERKFNPPIAGHHLLNEGHIFPIRRPKFGSIENEVVGYEGGCQCGARPEDRWPDFSARQMKAWHRGHKEEVRAAMEEESDERVPSPPD